MKVTNNCLGSKKSKSTDVDNATEFYLDSIHRSVQRSILLNLYNISNKLNSISIELLICCSSTYTHLYSCIINQPNFHL